jgi:energy-coupling factor transporter ATP-binding protein EcfA2
MLAAASPGTADIRIETGPEAARIVAQARAQPDAGHGVVWQGPHGGLCFSIADVGDFWIPDGHTINITPHSGADIPTLALYTMGSALGLALLFQDTLVLHCASLAIGRSSTLVLGTSGAGKSTLAQHLSMNGYRALGDDTCALWNAANKSAPVIYPSGTAFKLWRNALDAVGIDPVGHQSVGQRLDKYFVANAHAADDRPHTVSRIIVLEKSNGENCRPVLEPLDKLDAMQAVTEHVYRPQFVGALGLWKGQFSQISKLVAGTEVLRLTRPWGHEFMPEVIDLLKTGQNNMGSKEPIKLL